MQNRWIGLQRQLRQLDAKIRLIMSQYHTSPMSPTVLTTPLSPYEPIPSEYFGLSKLAQEDDKRTNGSHRSSISSGYSAASTSKSSTSKSSTSKSSACRDALARYASTVSAAPPVDGVRQVFRHGSNGRPTAVEHLDEARVRSSEDADQRATHFVWVSAPPRGLSEPHTQQPLH